MPYGTLAKPIRVDLSEIGETEDGSPFYAIVHTWRSLPHDRLGSILAEYPEVRTYLSQPSPQKARELLLSSAYAGVAGALIIEWNLVDFLTDEPLALPLHDPHVVNRVPHGVWAAIWHALAPQISHKTTKDNLVAFSSERK